MNVKQPMMFGTIVDFHSHILPGMDDGSENAQMSCAMLSEARQQGVRMMVATPHFYPEQEPPETFLKRRITAVKRLIGGGYDPARHPAVCVGAEVAYYPGISHSDALESLCIVGTKTILIEMPFGGWTQTMLDEVVAIRAARGLCPVLVHVDRYAESRKRTLLESLVEQGVLLQVNADAFVRSFMRRRAMRWFKEGTAQVLGSDCHNMTTRPPILQIALDALSEEPEVQARLIDIGQGLLAGVLTLATVQNVCNRPSAES